MIRESLVRLGESFQYVHSFEPVLRGIKGIPLTHSEFDNNFIGLEAIKLKSNPPTIYNLSENEYNVAPISGNYRDGQRVILIVTGSSANNAEITWDEIYRPIGVILPSSEYNAIYLAMIYNSYDTKWDVLGVQY
jgi:hypothetical protein